MWNAEHPANPLIEREIDVYVINRCCQTLRKFGHIDGVLVPRVPMAGRGQWAALAFVTGSASLDGV